MRGSETSPGGGLGAAVAGFLVVVGSCLGLLWAERAAEASGNQDARWAQEVVEASADYVDSANERQLVHVVGRADTGETVRDPLFGVQARALWLGRTVSMYQWQQRSRKRGKTTVYYYERDWSTSLVDSSRFREPGGHDNPTRFPHPSLGFPAHGARVGVFRLPTGLIAEMPKEPVTLLPTVLDGLPPELRSRAHRKGNAVFIGRNPDSPQIGDLRVAFQAVVPGDVSILARQVGDTFAPQPGQEPGQTLMTLRMGRLSAEAMFEARMGERAHTQSIWRGVAWLVAFGGVVLVLSGVAGAQGIKVGCLPVGAAAALVAAGLVAGVVLLVAVV